MRIDYKKISRIVLLLAIAIVLLLRSCSVILENNKLKQQVAVMKSENQAFSEEITKDGQKMAEQEQLIVSQKDAIDAGLIKIKNLKNVKSQVKVETLTQVDSFFVAFEPKDTLSADSSLSKNFSYKDPKDWFSIEGVVTQEGVGVSEMSVRNKYHITIADKKVGFFKAPTPSVILVNENPYTITEKMNNLVIENKSPFYKRPWFWAAIGIGTGLYLGKP
jgi:hypothetical protein